MTTIKERMDLPRNTWIAAVKLAVVISTIGALVAVAASALARVPDVAIVIVVAVVAFAVSWVRTGRLRSNAAVAPISVPAR